MVDVGIEQLQTEGGEIKYFYIGGGVIVVVVVVAAAAAAEMMLVELHKLLFS